jgi:acid phosphatase
MFVNTKKTLTHPVMQLVFVMSMLLVFFCTSAEAEKLPRPDHVVVVIEENRSYSQIMDKLRSDSYIHALARRGTLFTQSYGITHPSQPNYLALFSGSTQGITSNICPLNLSGENLASSLSEKGFSFTTFAESLPTPGDTSCISGSYQRKHNPQVNWPQLANTANQPFSDFPGDFSRLPTVSFVIPDQQNDMHDGTFFTADEWLKTHIKPYVEWAFKHNSLLILTWDEDDGKEGNRVVTLMVGPMVKTGVSNQRVNHYNVLRTLFDFYNLPAINASREAEPIQGIWNLR